MRQLMSRSIRLRIILLFFRDACPLLNQPAWLLPVSPAWTCATKGTAAGTADDNDRRCNIALAVCVWKRRESACNLVDAGERRLLRRRERSVFLAQPANGHQLGQVLSGPVHSRIANKGFAPDPLTSLSMRVHQFGQLRLIND
jgi:hypothetical protein